MDPVLLKDPSGFKWVVSELELPHQSESEERPQFPAPILETPSSIMSHAFNHDLNEAARSVSLEMVQLLKKFYDVSAEDAYSLLSVARDFSITQVAHLFYS